MKISNIILTAMVLGIAQISNAQKTNFSKTESNIHYAFLNGKERKKNNLAVEGDFVKFNYSFRINDSVFVKTRTAEEIPYYMALPAITKETNMYQNMPIEILYKVNKDDSVEVHFLAKDYFEYTGQPKIEWIKDTDTFKWNIKVIDFQSLALVQAKNAKMRKTSNDFLSTPDGLQYKFVELGKGGKIAGPNDLANFHVSYHIGDSLIFNSATYNEGKAVPQQLNMPQVKGDLMEGLLLMQAGDSAIFKVNAKVAAENTKQPLQPWMKETDEMIWHIRMVDIKSQKQLKEEQEAKTKVQNVKDNEIIQKYLADNNITNYQKTPSGLFYVIHNAGNGKKPTKGQHISVNYTGRLLNGKVFDSNVDPQFNHVDPFVFQVGQGGVIKGWDEGLLLLEVGQKATLYIPSSLAYGERGSGRDIGPNEILIFDVELLEIK